MAAFLHQGALIQLISNGEVGPSLCQIKSNDKGAKITSFKWFRFGINKIYGSDTCVQFSSLKFLTKSGLVFNYSDNDENITILRQSVGLSCTIGNWGAGNDEDGVHGLMSTGYKCCIVGADIPSRSEGNPYYITYELKTRSLDLSIYNKWHFYTANDHIGRTPYDFFLEVKNDGDDEWQQVDAHVGIESTGYHKLAYEGTIDISKLK